MSQPRHMLIAYCDDGEILRRPWRVRATVGLIWRDGPATDAQLRLWAHEHRFVKEVASYTDTRQVERAIIVRRQAGKPRVVARYLRSTEPTEDQQRLIERIIANPRITFCGCDPQPNGDVYLTIVGRPNTIVFRHPTEKELLYGTD